MSEKINHVNEAVTYSNLAWGNRDDPTFQRVYADLAQIHATLALVEQQRIANLIAVSVERHADIRRSNSDKHIILDDDGNEFGTDELVKRAYEVDVQIREGLGL